MAQPASSMDPRTGHDALAWGGAAVRIARDNAAGPPPSRPFLPPAFRISRPAMWAVVRGRPVQSGAGRVPAGRLPVFPASLPALAGSQPGLCAASGVPVPAFFWPLLPEERTDLTAPPPALVNGRATRHNGCARKPADRQKISLPPPPDRAGECSDADRPDICATRGHPWPAPGMTPRGQADYPGIYGRHASSAGRPGSSRPGGACARGWSAACPDARP